jgi:cation diffusion facilitator CzcD-associated flavoprotein CzcO
VQLNRPRTAIIGAGVSGLTAGKMLNDYGVPYTTFETSDRIGIAPRRRDPRLRDKRDSPKI